MAAPSLTYTLTNGTAADASQVMQNFTDLLNGYTDGSKDLSINALTVAGTATFNGNVALGNATGDTITYTGRVASAIEPATTATYALGSTGQVWTGIFLDNGATDGGAVFFNASSTAFLKSNAAGTVLNLGGFTGLNFNSAGDITTVDHVYGALNAVGDPTYSFTGDTDTGMYSSGANELRLVTGGVDRFQIDSNGGVFISADTSPIFGINHTNATASSSTVVYKSRFSADTDCTGGYFFSCSNSSNATIGRIEAASNTTVSYTTSSDKRLKTELQPFDGHGTIMKTKVGMFYWKDKPNGKVVKEKARKPVKVENADGTVTVIEKRLRGYDYDFGVYAQDEWENCPHAVSRGTDELTKDGSLKHPWAVDYSKYVPHLIDSVQKLTVMVQQLQAKLAA